VDSINAPIVITDTDTDTDIDTVRWSVFRLDKIDQLKTATAATVKAA
jgi:hypothetical protein